MINTILIIMMLCLEILLVVELAKYCWGMWKLEKYSRYKKDRFDEKY